MRHFRFFFLIPALLAVLLAQPAPALAHRVNVFAYVDGQDVRVECGFSRSNPVKNGSIAVVDESTGEVLLTGQTDEGGLFRFPVPEKARHAGHGLRIRLDAGQGHQNEWLIPAEEIAAALSGHDSEPDGSVASRLPGASGAAGVSGPSSAPDMSAPSSAPDAAPSTDSGSLASAGGTLPPAAAGPAIGSVSSAGQASDLCSGISEAEWKRLVNDALDAKLEPLKRMLAAQTSQEPTLRDIIGGIGWILGLFGIAAYFKRRP